MPQLGQIMARLAETLLIQRGHLFPWVPVAIACGIGAYFALPTEPGFGSVVACALFAGAGALAAFRAQSIAAPVLGWRYYGPIEGRIVGMDRSASDALRLTLDQVRLDRVAPDRTPRRIRLSLHGQQGFITPRPGMVILTTGHLSPPGGPVEPGGFDFQRHSWFAGLGAIGYTRKPVLTLRPPDPRDTRVFAARMAMSDRIRAALPGDTGAVAAALITGDRSDLTKAVTQALRQTNLAHLLAISGLHMGLVTGFVYGALRLIGAALPGLSLRWPVRSLAAAGALAAGAGYLVLSGGAIATERAFVMVAVAFLALIADRRAITLRALALAAFIVLLLRPEALLSPGFQMSFAATTALVAVFAGTRGYQGKWPRALNVLTTIALSSAIAGLATAPVGAAHFNMLAKYGLLANLASVPLMGVFVMPAGVIAVLLMPFGLEAVPLTAMGWGIDWVLGVALRVADWPGAVGHVPAPGPWVLPLFALGGLTLALWQGRGKWAGLAPLALAGVLWMQVQRPQILIDDRAQVVGVLGDKGRALSREKGAGFIAGVWLENDGSAKLQAEAASLWPIQAVALRHLRGKRAAASASCQKGEILILTHPAPGSLPCDVFDPKRLAQTGAVALHLTDQGIIMQTARDRAGRRLWNDKETRQNGIWWP